MTWNYEKFHFFLRIYVRSHLLITHKHTYTKKNIFIIIIIIIRDTDTQIYFNIYMRKNTFTHIFSTTTTK